MAEVMKTVYIVRDSDGDWVDSYYTFEEAMARIQEYIDEDDEPHTIEKRIQYFDTVTQVWPDEEDHEEW